MSMDTPDRNRIADHLTAIAGILQSAPGPLGATPAQQSMTLQPADFDTAFARLIGHEGGYQAHRADRGNWTSGTVGQGELRGTKYGITAMSYPTLDIKNLTLEQAKVIYRRDFWGRFHGDQLDGRVAFNLFDASVHHGVRRGVQLLQTAVGVADDGALGPITLAAVNALPAEVVVARLNAHRLLFCARLSTWRDFGAGWANRFAANILEGTNHGLETTR